MTNLVEAHAAAVKPSLASAPMPTTAVAEAAAAEAEEATAKGDVETAAKARKLAEAMAPAPAPPPPEPAPEVPQDRFAEIAATLDRGMWVEFEGEDGQLAFAKLAWVSPLRGTYLFTNRQGQKAVSLSADELAERFRNDRARLVEAEPLVDRAFTSMMATLEEKFADEGDRRVAARVAPASVLAPGQRLGDFDDKLRSPVDQPGIDLHQRRAGCDFFPRVLARHDAADADDGHRAVERLRQRANRSR